MNHGPAHDAHRLRVIAACERAGVVIYRSRLGYRLIGRHLDIEVSDLLHVQPDEVQRRTDGLVDALVQRRTHRPRTFFRY